eukprot:gene11076-biopygen13903
MVRAWRGLWAMFGLGWRGRGAGMARAWSGHALFRQYPLEQNVTERHRSTPHGSATQRNGTQRWNDVTVTGRGGAQRNRAGRRQDSARHGTPLLQNGTEHARREHERHRT